VPIGFLAMVLALMECHRAKQKPVDFVRENAALFCAILLLIPDDWPHFSLLHRLEDWKSIYKAISQVPIPSTVLTRLDTVFEGAFLNDENVGIEI
jgi:hypothetical protein